MSSYDLIVIGTGPGGYVCAIRASQLGMKVAVVEKRATHGGTCLNVGCIPSKALLHASEMFAEAGHGFKAMGIKVNGPELDLDGMMGHKDETVDANVKGVAFLLKKNKIDSYHGLGKIAAPGRVEIQKDNGDSEEISGKHIVIATGSDSANLPGIEVDEERVVSSTGALALSKVPEKLLVVGAGVIGLELGSVWRRLGAEVTVVEFLDRILPGMDLEIANQLQRSLKKNKIQFKLGTKVSAIDTSGKKLKVTVEPAAGGDTAEIETDIVLVAIGRTPCTDGLGLDEVGVKRDNRGRVITDDHLKTNVDGIYAIGDVIAGPMLAHKAEEEGVALAEQLAGQKGHVNYDVIPSVVYTMPELASVGRSEEDLKSSNVSYRVGKFSFSANGRARAIRQSEGMVKLLADAETDRVLGVHILGAMASEMIHEAAVIMEFSGSAEDLARTCHAHPTLSEAVKEAALASDKRAIHS